MYSNVFQIEQTNSTKKAGNCFHKCPSATPQKITIFIINFTISPNKISMLLFCEIYVGFFALCLGQKFFTEKQESKERTFPPLLSLSFSLFCCHIYLYHIVYFSRYKPFSLLPIRLSSLFISNAHTYFLVFLSLLSHLPKIYKYIDRLILFEIINFS